MKKSKIVSLAIAGTLTATVLLAGTYAWTSISQRAMNEVEGSVNPKTNFYTTEKDGSKTIILAGTDENGDPVSVTAEVIKIQEADDGRIEYVELNLPRADFTPDDTDQDEADIRVEGAAIDADTSTAIPHTVEDTLVTTQVITMAEWLALADDEKQGNFWVYDTDGWAYWANPLEEEESTGLLLDNITLGTINEKWYYGIYVECQMVTVEDIGSATNQVGFYSTEAKQVPSDDARKLLDALIDEIGCVEIETSAYGMYTADISEEELEKTLNQEETGENTDLEDLTELNETEDKEENEDAAGDSTGGTDEEDVTGTPDDTSGGTTSGTER